MVKISIGKRKLERLLEEQERRREERQAQQEASKVSESQLFEPAKRAIEADYCPDTGSITWYHEPDIVIGTDVSGPAARERERPDLICEWQPSGGGPSTLYVIELKRALDKRGLGQIVTYYWAMRNGEKIIAGDQEYRIEGNEMLIMFFAGLQYEKHYYDDVLAWVQQSLDMGSSGGIELLPLEVE